MKSPAAGGKECDNGVKACYSRIPGQAKTINKILGRDFIVKASMGHVRDLPDRTMGVDVKDRFKPKYVIIKRSEKIVRELQQAAKPGFRSISRPTRTAKARP